MKKHCTSIETSVVQSSGILKRIVDLDYFLSILFGDQLLYTTPSALSEHLFVNLR